MHFFKKILYAAMLMCLSFIACVSPSEASVLTTTSEFTFKQATGFESQEPYSQVWHYKNSTYLVWVDAKYRAWVTQVTDGKVVTAPVDAQPDYLVQADGHHRFALGVDTQGYIHVTGDMHHYSDLSTGVITPYPARYQNKKILYWRSNKPEDVSGGFTFKGDTFDTAIPGSGWILGRFFTDNNGVLFYSSHVHAYESSNNLGQMAVGLYKYNTTTQAWVSIGGLAPKTDPYLSHHYPVFYWEDSGASGGWFQNYQASFKFDKANNMYFAVTGNTNSTLSGANRLLFAMSPDGGVTWKKANGTVISPLPLRGIDNLPNSADVVEDGGTKNSFGARPGILVDKNGKIGITVDGKWRVWNGSAWTQDTKQNFTNFPSADAGYRLPNNNLILNTLSYNKLLQADTFDSSSVGYDFIGYNNLNCLDDYGLRTSGIIYGIGTKVDKSGETLLKTTIDAAPLPTGWLNQDIDATGFSFGGNAGYLNGSFTLTSYGDGFADLNDSFHYAYKKMRGDGVITTKVDALQLANGRGGVMMRETLDPSSTAAGVYINANKSVLFTSRSKAGSYATSTEVANITAPYWVRLVRSGDVFTGYLSPDGTTWTKIQSSTIPMNQDVYVGLALASYRFKWFMEAATFENTSAPANICDHVNPKVSISPSVQTGPAGQAVNYDVSITNNDNTSCPASDFALTTVLPTNVTGKLDAAKLNVAAGATGKTNLSLSSLSTTPAGNYNFSVQATNGALKDSASGVYTITNACVLAEPTIKVSSATNTTYGLTPVNYVISITNNDATACATRLFSFSTDTTNYYLRGWMEPYNIRLVPGKTATSLVTLTPVLGLKQGTYTISTYTQNGGLAKSTLVYGDQPAVIVKTTTDKVVYDRTATPFNAVLYASVLSNNTPVPNVPIKAKLTWPDGSMLTMSSTTGSGVKTFYQAIQRKSQVGIYNFNVVATYQGNTISQNVMFSVR